MILHIRKHIHCTTALLLSLILLFSLSACGKVSKTEPFSNTTIAMGTVVSQVYYSDDEETSKAAAEGVTSVINDLDLNKLSRNVNSSEISKLNKLKTASVSEITCDCISMCLKVSNATDGLFDITVGELSSLWGIGTENARVPSEAEINSVLPKINHKEIITPDFSKDADLSELKVSIGENQTIDLGAVGKGLACDEARKILRINKVIGGTVSVGGSILVYGTNPDRENGNFLIGIRNPFGTESEYMGVISTKDCCISTSGDYEKVLEANGKKYHHILNPKTGYPAESNLTSVTVISYSGLLSDALSTACFIMGYSEDTLKLLEKFESEAVFILKDKSVVVTDGLKDDFTVTNNDFKLKA